MGVDQRREREREEGSELVMPCLRILAVILGDDADAAIALQSTEVELQKFDYWSF